MHLSILIHHAARDETRRRTTQVRFAGPPVQPSRIADAGPLLSIAVAVGVLLGLGAAGLPV